MSLPIDIPWKRMGVSGDMIDPKAGDLQFPEEWRSSVSVFYHEPTEVPPEYCDRKITYLKVVCTITNYQLPTFRTLVRGKGHGKDQGRVGKWTLEDVTVLDEMREKYADFYAWKDFEARVTDSYPCYGVLLQVGIYPNPAEGVELHDFPYFSGLQPRKREMYEMVTQSGEVLSQSGTKTNVAKGTTTTDSNESYDLDLGGKKGLSLGLLGTWGWEAKERQVGEITRDQTQKQDVTTTDASREKRESHAYSTNINQLYNLLESYHLGTNRVMFFMQPRPHIQDAKFTFIRGLRRLEGIQEFFLIVNRPASVPGICVEVALETAHLYARRAFSPRIVNESESKLPENLQKTAAGLQISEDELRGLFPLEFRLVEAWNSASLWTHWLAVAFRDQQVGWDALNGWFNEGSLNREAFFSCAEVAVRFPDVYYGGRIALLFDEFESDSGDMFIVGRRLCSCLTPVSNEDEELGTTVDREQSSKDNISTCDGDQGIVYETPYPGTAIPGVSFPRHCTKALALNTLISDINRKLKSSIGSPNRIPYGELPFLGTTFMINEMQQLIRLLGHTGIGDRALNQVKGLRTFVDKGLGKTSGIRTILDLGRVSPKMIAKDLHISGLEAQKQHRDLLITALKSLDETTIRSDIKSENPIIERFFFEFPEKKFHDLESSALIYTGKPISTQPPKSRRKRSRVRE